MSPGHVESGLFYVDINVRKSHRFGKAQTLSALLNRGLSNACCSANASAEGTELLREVKCPKFFFFIGVITPYNPLIKNMKGVIRVKTMKYYEICLLGREGAKKYGENKG